MNEASEKDKEIIAASQASQQDSGASQNEYDSGDHTHVEPKLDLESNASQDEIRKLKLKRGSPARKLKSKKIKKVRPAPKDAAVKNSTPPTDIELQIQARKAFPCEYGDRGSERRARERDIAVLHEKLVRQRDGETSGVETSAQEDLTSAEESGPDTRHLANTFDWKYSQSAFIACDRFKGARGGYSFKLGQKGLGYYSDTKKKRSSKRAQEQDVTMVTETDSDENNDPLPRPCPRANTPTTLAPGSPVKALLL